MSTILKKIADFVVGIVATGLGTGYSPLAPGTAGSLLACVIAWFAFPLVWWIQVIIVAACFFIGVAVASEAEKWWGHDPHKVVIDEVAGQWLALLLVPRAFIPYLAAFLLFRLFDITKPLGIRSLEKIRGSWGVMLDDLLSGIYSNIVVQLLLMLLRQTNWQLPGLSKF